MTRLTAVVATAVIASVAGYANLAGQRQAAPAAPQYMKPRFPARLKMPETVEELMPYARAAARNKSNILGQGLGIANAGDTILLVGSALSDDKVVEAVKRALEERKVKVVIMNDYDIAGVTREQAAALAKASESKFTTEHGYIEAANWVRQAFPGGAGMAWLKQNRPDLYDQFYPQQTEQLPPALQAIRAKMRGEAGQGRGPGPVVQGIVTYLQKHPEVRGAFYGKGGPIWMGFHPIEHRWLGTFTQDDRNGLVSEVMSYPADVWMLTEELAMEPLAYTDKVQANDPEGTDVTWDLTVEQAQKWAKGVYLRGHLFLFPNEAYGQYALSVVNYPALQKDWISPEPMVLLNGKVAGTNGHGGFYPRIEETFKDGYLVDVKEGGLYGEALRAFMKYPRIHELPYPFFKHPGYFYHFESALGTNPKVVRNPLGRFGGTSPERMRAGVFHWALGQNLWNDPDTGGGSSQVTQKWAAENKMPASHGFHIHSYFTTFKLHLRNTEKWVTITDKGRFTSLDNPEVRALASRYGNPDEILTEDWVPEIPGINAPGQYEDYARDPYKYAKAVEDKVLAGKYEHLTKPRSAPASSRSQQ